MSAWEAFTVVGGFAVTTLVGVIATLETSNSIAFAMAKSCFVLGAADVLGYSAYVAFNAPASVAAFYFLACIPAWGLVLPLLVIGLQWISDREWMVSARLKPEDPDIVYPGGMMRVLLGYNIAGGSRMPHTVLRVEDEPAIVIDRDKRGHIVISTIKVYDDRGDAVLVFYNNKFQTGPTAWKPFRPDPHTLVAFNRKAEEVLRITLLAPDCLKIKGIFHRQKGPPLLIEDVDVRCGGSSMVHCFIHDNACDIAVGGNLGGFGIKFP